MLAKSIAYVRGGWLSLKRGKLEVRVSVEAVVPVDRDGRCDVRRHHIAATGSFSRVTVG